MSNQYDLPPEQLELAKEKLKRKTFLRNEFLKLKSDPFAHASGQGGVVFDPAVQRYNALRVSGFEYFKPSGKSSLIGFGLVVLPIFTFSYFLNKSRTKREALLRNGEISYKDREFKFA